MDKNTKVNERRNKDPEYKYTWRHQLRRLPWLLLIPLGIFIPKLVQKYPDKVERIYARGIFPVLSRIVGWISSLVPVSLAELIIVIVGAVLVLVLVIRLLRVPFGKLANRRKNRVRLFSFIISICIFAGVLLNLFYVMWGFNHYRMPLPNLLGLEIKQHTTDDLADLTERLAIEAAELRAQVAEDENGIYTIGDKRLAMNSVVNAYNRLGQGNELFSNKCYPAKMPLFSKMLSKLDIAGIYIPYTAEENVNVEQPDLYVLSGAAHETAHYFGFAREDEANFLAFYASRWSADASLRYSSTMLALINCANKLYEDDRDRYFAIRSAYYTEGMERDLADYRVYYEKYENDPVGQINDQINDAYLVYHGQQDGIKSYGRMVDLLLDFYSKNPF